jgi:hypothetical protein
MGDDVQMLKMGILEIADVYAVNKADLGGAENYAEFLREALVSCGAPDRARRELGGQASDAFISPIVATSARTGQGVAELAAAVESHRRHLAERPARRGGSCARWPSAWPSRPSAAASAGRSSASSPPRWPPASSPSGRRRRSLCPAAGHGEGREGRGRKADVLLRTLHRH